MQNCGNRPFAQLLQQTVLAMAQLLKGTMFLCATGKGTLTHLCNCENGPFKWGIAAIVQTLQHVKSLKIKYAKIPTFWARTLNLAVDLWKTIFIPPDGATKLKTALEDCVLLCLMGYHRWKFRQKDFQKFGILKLQTWKLPKNKIRK